MNRIKAFWLWPWSALSLRQTLFLGAGLGILLPATLLAFFQISNRFETEVNLRVRAPMLQYADVLSRGVAAAIWNLDRGVASELMDAVMRNPDVLSVTVTDEYKGVFVVRQTPGPISGERLREEREVSHNGAHVGRIAIEMSTARIAREFKSDLIKLAAALAAQVVISFSLIWLLFDRRLMRPLQALQEGASRLARGELGQPIRWHRRDEIGRLAGGLDRMRSELEALLKERDQKNVALQHELGERRRTEQALSFSQAKFEAIFNASPVAMTVSRMGDGAALLDLNAAWETLFAHTRSQALGSGDVQADLWRDPLEHQSVMTALAQSGAVAQRAAWFKRGGVLADIYCEISGRVITLGTDSLLILAYEDITAKRQYEEDILALNASLEQRVGERTQELSDALERLTAAQFELVRVEKMSALGSLVAGVAHELNTPIGNSLTVASTLQDQSKSFAADIAHGLTRSKLDAFVANIREGSGILMRGLQHAADLVSSFKQVAVDQTSVNRRRFDLRDTVDEILLTLGPSIRKTTHTVECSIAKNIPMESYPGPLGQVLTNLINNAVLHGFDGRTGGKISIHAAALDDSQVLFTVQDDGNGIPEAHLSRVFDPFFTTKLGKGGSGLGLSIVYNLVQDVLGGKIHVTSEPGKGACFTLTVPKIAPTTQA